MRGRRLSMNRVKALTLITGLLRRFERLASSAPMMATLGVVVIFAAVRAGFAEGRALAVVREGAGAVIAAFRIISARPAARLGRLPLTRELRYAQILILASLRDVFASAEGVDALLFLEGPSLGLDRVVDTATFKDSLEVHVR